MKDGVVIVNTARGELINLPDFVEALETGKVFAAGLDVLETEPIEPDNPLLKFPNVYIASYWRIWNLFLKKDGRKNG
jgi:Phosphoglycerate dehydrogenase and related dehydrogenases